MISREPIRATSLFQRSVPTVGKPQDEALLNKLKTHLRPLQRQGLIDVWYDREISAGTEWEQEIKQHLNTAQIILLLVSPDFMDSDYCYGIEMTRAIERHKSGEARVIPIILRWAIWKETPIGKLQGLPTDASPITSGKWHDQDEAFYDVAKGIREAVEARLAEEARVRKVAEAEQARLAEEERMKAQQEERARQAEEEKERARLVKLERVKKAEEEQARQAEEEKRSQAEEERRPCPGLHPLDQSEGDVADVAFFPNPYVERERVRLTMEKRVQKRDEWFEISRALWESWGGLATSFTIGLLLFAITTYDYNVSKVYTNGILGVLEGIFSLVGLGLVVFAIWQCFDRIKKKLE